MRPVPTSTAADSPPARSTSAPAVRGATVPAVDRALSLLDRLARQREPMSLARLAADLALPKSSVHGLCNTLLSHGYLRRQSDGAFRLGPRVMSLAEAFVAGTGVAQEFSALWPDAAAAPEETVVLSVLNGSEVVYIAARQGTRPLGLAFSVGMRLPAWLTATGKALLAWQPPAALQALLGAGPLAPLAGSTPLPLAALRRELALIRQRGWSVDDEGVREGVYCIGAPVFDAAGEVVAGLGVCIHKAQTDPDADGRHRAAVLQAAATLTERLGGQPPTPSPAPARRAANKAKA
jgi:DNA-binding IclR family transcriptional regulator